MFILLKGNKNKYPEVPEKVLLCYTSTSSIASLHCLLGLYMHNGWTFSKASTVGPRSLLCHALPYLIFNRPELAKKYYYAKSRNEFVVLPELQQYLQKDINCPSRDVA